MVDMQTIMDEMNKTKQLLNQKKQDNNQKQSESADSNKEDAESNDLEQPKELLEDNNTPELELPATEDENNTKDDDDDEIKLPDLNEETEEIEQKPEVKPISQQKPQKTQPVKQQKQPIESKISKKQPLKATNNNNNDEYLSAVKELNANVVELLQLLKTTADEIRKEDPLAAKVEQISDQNDKIAQALLSVADMIKDLQTQVPQQSFAPKLSTEVPNNPNMPAYKEPNYSFAPDKNSAAFRPKFIATDTGEELELPKPPPDDMIAMNRMQPLPETRSNRSPISSNKEELRPLDFNNPPSPFGDTKKKGLFR
ncbi:hypothetical protein HZA96_00065 [Candidatus Woesearchaeota archaeon]|nr:hypothetical protein [Candidatus Woesearchaeota archaeon]